VVLFTINSESRIGDLAKQLPREMDAALGQGMQQIFGLAQLYCPYRTGRLRASGSLVHLTMGVYTIVYTAPYAQWVHDGARGRAGNPWLRRAAMDGQAYLDYQLAQVADWVDTYGL